MTKLEAFLDRLDKAPISQAEFCRESSNFNPSISIPESTLSRWRQTGKARDSLVDEADKALTAMLLHKREQIDASLNAKQGENTDGENT